MKKKVKFFVQVYERERSRISEERDKARDSKWALDYKKLDVHAKWTRLTKSLIERDVKIAYEKTLIQESMYRPFVKRFIYFSKQLNEMQYRLPSMTQSKNKIIAFHSMASSHPLATFAVRGIFDNCLLKSGNGISQGISRYRYVGADQIDNVTDWALEQFTSRYGSKIQITKDDIFHYVYAVLHDPVYREAYALNLRREFPRIPFYPNFPRWVTWGKTLMDLHIGYESVEPWPLTRTNAPMSGGEPQRKGKSKDLFEDRPGPSAKREADTPKPRLKADKDAGIIELDTQTQLSGIPPEAWTYRLGNRSALEWVLDQHKERKPSDPTVREKFNTYRFADHKERVVDLLGRVTRVSIETMAIIKAMSDAPR